MKNKENYNKKYAELVTRKLTDYLQKICPDKNMQNANQNCITDEILDRMQVQYNILATDYFDYKIIFDFCVQQGFKRIYDIGGANGFANFIIKEENLPLEYIVVDKMQQNEVFAPLIDKYYPQKIKATPEDVLISHLCLGILYDPHNQPAIFNRALNDFDHIILHTYNTNCKELNELFPNKILEKNETSTIQYFDTSSHAQLPTPQNEMVK